MTSFFYALGLYMSRLKYFVLVIWLIVFCCCVPFLPKIMTPFQSSGFENIHSQSQKTNLFVNDNLGYHDHRLMMLFKKECSCCSDTIFRDQVLKSLKVFKKLPDDHEIILTQEKGTILAVLAFKEDLNLSPEDVNKLQDMIKKPKHALVYFGGEDVFVDNVNKQTQKDLYHADMIAAPVSVITLLFVFGSVIAAFMPIFIGGICAVMMLTSLYAIAYLTSLSIFTINIALLLGLCLSLDYALFIICRFREELLVEKSVEKAIAKTSATAGKAVFFSGLAVFCSLSALLLFPINILISVGIGGLCAVLLAVVGALTLLPALLAIIKRKINWGAVHRIESNKSAFWNKLAMRVIAHPILCVLMGLSILAVCIYPIKDLKLGISDYHILPIHSEGRAFFNAYQDTFEESELSPITLVVQTKGSVKSKKNIKTIYRLIEKIRERDDVDKITGYLTILPKAHLEQYQQFYQMPKDRLPSEVKQLLKTSTKDNLAIFYIDSHYSSESKQTQQLVKDLRDMQVKNLTLWVTGVPANNYDVFMGIKDHLPQAVGLILLFTFIILMVLLRSLFLPMKAIIMNMISLASTYGVLVFIFQEGHFHEFLNFEPQGNLDISMLVIIFCALFGFSMDYEVFLLTRIQEYYLKTKNNSKSIVYGIEHSARIITSAALIVIVLCGSFLVADVLMVKAFGLGIAVAIFIDAFIIRTFLVPAIMVLTERINWYIPSFLAKILPKNNHH